MRKNLKGSILLATLGLTVSVALANPAYAAEKVDRHYGPMITINGTAEEQDLKIHSRPNLTVNDSVIGTIVAYGKNNTITINAGSKDIGMNDNKVDEVMKVKIDSSKLVGSLADPKWTNGSVYEGDLTIYDPIIAKAEMGGVIKMTGHDMHYNLLYAHKNQYGEHQSDEEMTSKIHVDLTGDLLIGDENNPSNDNRPDWLRSSGIPGGSFKIGSIDTGAKGDGEIIVHAKNINTNYANGFEESNIGLFAKENLYIGTASNQHESNMDLMGKTITIDAFGASGYLTTTQIGNDKTETITFNNDMKLKGGSSVVTIKANDSVTMKKGWNFEEDRKDAQGKKADVMTIDSKNVTLNGEVKAHKDLVTVNATEAITLDAKGKKWEIANGSHVVFNGKTIGGTLSDIEFKKPNNWDEKAAGSDDAKGELSFNAQGGDLTVGKIRATLGDYDVNFKGFDHLNVNYITTESLSQKGNAYTSNIYLGGKNITLKHNGDRSRQQDSNSFASIHSAMSNVVIDASETLRTEGHIYNQKDTTIKAKDYSAYRLDAGTFSYFDYYGFNKATKLDVTAEKLVVDTAAFATFGSELNIKAKEFSFKEGGAAIGDDNDTKNLNDIGTVWASRKGKINISIDTEGAAKFAAINEKVLNDSGDADYYKGYILDQENYLKKIKERLKTDPNNASYKNRAKETEELLAELHKIMDNYYPTNTGDIHVDLAPKAIWTVTNKVPESKINTLSGTGMVRTIDNAKLTIDKVEDSPALLVAKDSTEAPYRVITPEGKVLAGLDTTGLSEDDVKAYVENGLSDGKILDLVKVGASDADPATKIEGLTVEGAPVFMKGKLHAFVPTIVRKDTLTNTPTDANIYVVDTKKALTESKDVLHPVATSFPMVAQPAVNIWKHLARQNMHYATKTDLGENIWASVNHDKFELEGVNGTDTTLTVGAVLKGAGKIAQGVSLSHTTSHWNGMSPVKAEYTGVSYHANTDLANGVYLKGVASIGKLSSTTDGLKGMLLNHGIDSSIVEKSNNSTEVSTLTAAIGGEIGKSYKAKRGVYLTPFVGLSYNYINGFDQDKIGDFSSHVKGIHSLFSEFGVRASKAFTPAFNMYGQLSFGYELTGNKTKVEVMTGNDSSTIEVKGDRSTWGYEVGGQYKANANLFFDFSFAHYNKGPVDNSWNGQLRANYKF